MKISEPIRKKLQAAVAEAGSAKEFARICHISQSNISRYLSGETQTISEDNWSKLAPFVGIAPELWQQQGIVHTPQLAEFLRRELQNAGYETSDLPALLLAPPLLITEILQQHILWPPELLAALLDILRIDRKQLPVSAAECQLLPAAGIFAAGAAVMRLLPIRELNSTASLPLPHAAETEAGFDSFTARIPVPADLRDDTKAFRIGDDTMAPLLQRGDIILTIGAALREIPAGKVVVAAINSGNGETKVVCRRFFPMENNFFTLKGETPGSEVILLKKSDIKWLALAVRRITTL